MSDEENKEKDHFLVQAEKQFDKAKERVQEQEELEKDLRTNPRYKDFFSQYRPDSVESFIKEYARSRSHWVEHGEWMLKQAQDYKNLYTEMAEDALWEIQQKKLFNLQCEWRAEKIKIPEVNICYDFSYWEAHIKECPFLPLVTEDEVELYIQYLHSNNVNFGPRWDCLSWQDYEEFKELCQAEHEHELPEWYQFYDSRKGTGLLLTFPDVRGEKEEFYFDLCRKKHSAPYLQKEKENPQLPYLGGMYSEEAQNFISQFETKHIMRCYEMYYHKREGKITIHDDMDLDNAIETLLNANETIALPPSSDWRQAIIDASMHYDARQIAEHIPQAYEEYKMKIEMNLPLTVSDENNTGSLDTKQQFEKMLIEGRTLNGEPPDLNF